MSRRSASGEEGPSSVLRLCAKAGLAVAAALFAALAILAGGVAWRLSTGPLTIDLLTPYLAAELAESIGGDVGVEIAGTSVSWQGFGAPLLVTAANVRINDPDRRTLATLPAVSVALAVQPLLNGDIRPTDLFIDRPRMVAVMDREGPRVAWAAGPDSGRPAAAARDGTPRDTGPQQELAAILATLMESNPAESGVLAEVDHIAVREASVRVLGEGGTGLWHLPVANIDLYRSADRLRIQAAGRLDQDERPAEIAATATYAPASGTTELEIVAVGLEPATVAAMDPLMAPLDALSVRISGNGVIWLDRDLAFQSGRFSLTGGVGRIDLPELYERPMSFAGLTLAGSFDARHGSLVIDRLEVGLGGPRLVGEARLTRPDQAIEAAASLSLRDMPVDLVDHYWPRGLGGGARDWITANISRGMVRRADLDVLLRIEDGDWNAPRIAAVRGRLDYDDLWVRYLEGMPPVTAVAGTGTYDGTDLSLDIETGRLRDVVVRDGTIRIYDVGQPPPEPIEITVSVAGPLQTALAVLDSPRLGYAGEVGIDPGSVEGRMATRLDAAFPLRDGLPMEEVAISAVANIRDAAIGQVFSGLAVNGIDGELRLDGRGMSIDGTARAAGLPVEFTWRESFDDDAAAPTLIRVSGSLTEEVAAGFGLPDFLQFAGRAPMEAVYRRLAGGSETVVLDADLEPARLGVPAAGWSKPQGEAARASATLILGPEGVRRIDEASLTAPDVTVSGSAGLRAAPPGFSEIRVDAFRSGRHDVTAQIAPTGADGYAVTLGGSSLNLAPLLDRAGALFAAEPGESGGMPGLANVDLQLVADIARVWIGDRRYLESVGAAATLADGALLRASLSAGVPGGGVLNFAYDPAHEPFDAGLSVSDIGSALRSLAGTAAIENGHLEMVAREIGSGEDALYEGQLRAQRLRVVEAPAVARFFAATTPAHVQEMLSREDLVFDSVTADFRFDRGNGRLRLSDGRAIGGALGLTFSGTVGPQGFDMDGVFVPLYGINQAIGSIPLLGDLLTGGEGGGVFALAFSVTGPADSPRIDTHPLSALTPGFLRGLLFGSGGDNFETPDNAILSDRPGGDR